ncbi:hypothetical protein FF1_004884 [Malus domestica]
MTEPKPDTPQNVPPSEINNNAHTSKPSSSFSGQKIRFPNPPDPEIPDAATLREQWKFAIRQYSKWYSHAWGTAILAGASFFALGWFIKGGNPLPSVGRHEDSPPPPPPDKSEEARRP